jgi:hypothetical protein
MKMCTTVSETLMPGDMGRIIKLQPVYRQVSKWDRSYRTIPKLTLSGDWLIKEGFAPAKYVEVECFNGKLVVTAIQ